jgi:DNA repair photolyase
MLNLQLVTLVPSRTPCVLALEPCAHACVYCTLACTTQRIKSEFVAVGNANVIQDDVPVNARITSGEESGERYPRPRRAT